MQISKISSRENSLDWRFLLPITTDSKVLIIGYDCENIHQYFIKLGMMSVYYCTDVIPVSTINSDNAEEKRNVVTFTELKLRPDLLSFFDIVVFPHGLVQMDVSDGKTGESVEHHFVKKYVRSGGIILIGFANGIFPGNKKNQSDLYFSDLWKMRRWLKTNGYTLTGIHGAIPDQFIPEHIFPISHQSISFILKSRYAYKMPNLLLRWMESSFLTRIIANFFPAYFVVATVNF